jgi:hypothetical protein
MEQELEPLRSWGIGFRTQADARSWPVRLIDLIVETAVTDRSCGPAAYQPWLPPIRLFEYQGCALSPPQSQIPSI